MGAGEGGGGRGGWGGGAGGEGWARRATGGGGQASEGNSSLPLNHFQKLTDLSANPGERQTAPETSVGL